jgi:16S rRNA (guanine(966)-N(2))-methyltransferase RsmD
MRAHLRIVAGSLRGRKLYYTVNPRLRPAPQMLREALFNMLQSSVPDRPFYDVFAGTGVVGLEALSRGAERVEFVERDPRAAAEIERNLREFGVADRASVVRADAYRWAQRWQGLSEPVNVFVGPPYPDFKNRFDDLVMLIADLQTKSGPGSVLVLQAERTLDPCQLPASDIWKSHTYGRNRLLVWVKPDSVPS